MTQSRVGRLVRITGGIPEFVGKLGTISEYDEGDRMFRVKLLEPVQIPGVGLVTDDLWEGRLLREVFRRTTFMFERRRIRRSASQ